MIDKVWVATTGTYSDYRIRHIFTEKYLANAWLQTQHDCHAPRIEEHELNACNNPIGCKLYFFSVKGTELFVDSVREEEEDEWSGEWFSGTAWATDEIHLRKIVADRYRNAKVVLDLEKGAQQCEQPNNST